MVETSGPIPTTEFIYAMLIRLWEKQEGIKITYTLEKVGKGDKEE